MEQLKQFSQLTLESIGNYVYCLIDNANDIFYVGKGTGNRVFMHEIEANNPFLSNEKIERIREIINKGGVAGRKIIRWGLTNNEATLLESAIIDVIGLDSLTNAVSGKYSQFESVEDIERIYTTSPIEPKHKIALFKINRLYFRNISRDELYNITKEAWVVNEHRVRKIEFVLAVANGIVREVYKPDKWYKTEHSVPKQRFGFHGELAPDDIRELYINKSIKNYIKKGATNPVKYINV